MAVRARSPLVTGVQFGVREHRPNDAVYKLANAGHKAHWPASSIRLEVPPHYKVVRGSPSPRSSPRTPEASADAAAAAAPTASPRPPPTIVPRTSIPPEWRAAPPAAVRAAPPAPTAGVSPPRAARPALFNPASAAATDEHLFGARSVLKRFRARGDLSTLGPLSGRSVRASLEDQMSELQAFACQLANDLEKAAARVGGLAQERERGEQRQRELSDHIKFLEWSCSQVSE